MVWRGGRTVIVNPEIPGAVIVITLMPSVRASIFQLRLYIVRCYENADL